MSLCAGLALLGLCLPIPGTTRAEVDAAGWFTTDDAGKTWASNRNLSSGTYRVFVGLMGTEAKLEAVVVREAQGDARAESALQKICTAADGSTSKRCQLGGKAFVVESCGRGLLLYAPTLPAPRVKELRHWVCEVLETMLSQ